MSIETIIVLCGATASVGGFVIAASVMMKNNEQRFKSLQDIIASGFDKVDLRFGYITQKLDIEREGMERSVESVVEEVKGLRDQQRTEIYPRLNAVEKQVGENYRALKDHKELCNIKCHN